MDTPASVPFVFTFFVTTLYSFLFFFVLRRVVSTYNLTFFSNQTPWRLI